MRVKLTDVARDAGVSIATVSCVISGKRQVSEKTKAKVISSIEKLGYTPDLYARAFKSNRPTVIGVIVPEISARFYSVFLRELERRLSDEGIQMIVSSSQLDPKQEAANIRTMTGSLVDGLVAALIGTGFDEINSMLPSGFPLVFFDQRPKGLKNYDIVTSGTYDATYEAVKNLLESGKKRVGAVFYTRDPHGSAEHTQQEEYGFSVTQREKAYYAALRDCGAEYGDRYAVYQGYFAAPSEGPLFFSAFRRVMELGCDAVLTTSQPMTEQLLDFMQILGVSDITHVGFNDYSWMDRAAPGIGTVVQPIEQMAAETARLIVTRVRNGYKTPAEDITLQSRYVPPSI